MTARNDMGVELFSRGCAVAYLWLIAGTVFVGYATYRLIFVGWLW